MDSQSTKSIINFISSLSEYYCLEDYGNFTMVKLKEISYNNNNLKAENYIAVIFIIGKKEKQLIKEINDLKKVFLFIRIYFEEKYINILIHRNQIIMIY